MNEINEITETVETTEAVEIAETLESVEIMEVPDETVETIELNESDETGKDMQETPQDESSISIDIINSNILPVGVRFKKAGKVYLFDPGDINLVVGDGVVVETTRGIEYGEVVICKNSPCTDHGRVLKRIIRKATDEDLKLVAENREKEKKAFEVCLQKIQKHELPMKLVNVEYTFDNNKIVFYFTAEGRVDFRELVKDLAVVFKTRIELRQIGVRDETKMLGGLGPCGRAACCSVFLGEFQPVSIRMAKEQSLSLSPTKISGLCGRLMCCLNYEHEYYDSLSRILPRNGSDVMTPDGKGMVMESNVLKQTLKVRITLKDGSFDLREYELASVKLLRQSKRPKREEPIIIDEEIKTLLDD